MAQKPISNRKSFGEAPYILLGGLLVLMSSIPLAWWKPEISMIVFYVGAAIIALGSIRLIAGAFRYSRRLGQIEQRRSQTKSAPPAATAEPNPNAETHARQAQPSFGQTKKTDQRSPGFTDQQRMAHAA